MIEWNSITTPPTQAQLDERVILGSVWVDDGSLWIEHCATLGYLTTNFKWWAQVSAPPPKGGV